MVAVPWSLSSSRACRSWRKRAPTEGAVAIFLIRLFHGCTPCRHGSHVSESQPHHTAEMEGQGQGR